MPYKILIVLDKWSPQTVAGLTTLRPDAEVSILINRKNEVPTTQMGRCEFLVNAYESELLSNYDLVLTKSNNDKFNKQILHDANQAGVTALFQDYHTNTHTTDHQKQKKLWQRIAILSLSALFFMFVGHAIFSHYPPTEILAFIKSATLDDPAFLWMLAAGFIAQMVDGMLGMGYGVMSTTILLSTGLNPAAISGSIHTAEMFSSGASGFSHYKFGNINKKLFKTLLIPGILGAVIGAVALYFLGEAYEGWIRPILSVYTLLLGIRIFYNAFKKNRQSEKVKNAGWLAGAGGFLDSFGGGGWGPLVTSTLISKGKTPRYVIGTVSLTEFFVTFGSAVTFFILLGASHTQTILGLIVGGLLAAPIAARLAGKLPLKSMLIGVAVLVIASSLRTLIKTLGFF